MRRANFVAGLLIGDRVFTKDCDVFPTFPVRTIRRK